MLYMQLSTVDLHRLLILALMMGMVIQPGSIGMAAEPVVKAKADAADTGLTFAEARFVSKLERRLVTKLNSKDNPADRDTWYVLLFLDRAVAQTYGESSRTKTLATLRLWKPDGTIVQGRRAAALATARFLFGTNNAAKGVSAPGTGERREASRFGGDKRWEYRAFKTEAEAKAFLLHALPQQSKKR